MRTIITTEYGESRVISGKFWAYPGLDCHYAFWADAVGGPRKQGLTLRERSGHPKHGVADAERARPGGPGPDADLVRIDPAQDRAVRDDDFGGNPVGRQPQPDQDEPTEAFSPHRCSFRSYWSSPWS